VYASLYFYKFFFIFFITTFYSIFLPINRFFKFKVNFYMWIHFLMTSLFLIVYTRSFFFELLSIHLDSKYVSEFFINNVYFDMNSVFSIGSFDFNSFLLFFKNQNFFWDNLNDFDSKLNFFFLIEYISLIHISFFLNFFLLPVDLELYYYISSNSDILIILSTLFILFIFILLFSGKKFLKEFF